MYLYLGQSTVISTKDVIGIFDLENTTTSKHTRDFLAASQKSGEIVEVTEDLPKSFVICKQGSDVSVYLSQISPTTLKKRTGFLTEFAEP